MVLLTGNLDDGDTGDNKGASDDGDNQDNNGQGDGGTGDNKNAGDTGNPEWNKDIGESTKERVDKFKDVDSLAKGYVELEDKLSAGFKKPETDEEKAKLWAKLGRPTDAKNYELEGDDELGFKTHAFELGLTQEQVTSHAQWFKGIVDRQAEVLAGKSKASEVKLRETWGNEYKDNMALADRALAASYSDDLIDRFEQGGFLDDAEFISHLYRAGKQTADDSIGGGGNLREVERTEAGQPYLDFPSMTEYEENK